MKIFGGNVDLVYGSHNPVEGGGEQRTEGMRDTREEILSGSVLCCVKEYEYLYEH